MEQNIPISAHFIVNTLHTTTNTTLLTSPNEIYIVGRAPSRGRAMRYSLWSVLCTTPRGVYLLSLTQVTASQRRVVGSLVKAAKFTWLFWLRQHALTLTQVPNKSQKDFGSCTQGTPPTKKTATTAYSSRRTAHKLRHHPKAIPTLTIELIYIVTVYKVIIVRIG
jgi:hypothetical protein